MNNPLVSVSVITYNHENFLPQALDNIISQEVNFPFEIVIGEDCSTDNTRAICLEYKERYPELIRLRLPESNLGSMNNWIENIRACRGKYIALCEGDDYWTDNSKLQRQFNFMEKNPDYSLTTHNAIILGYNGKMIYNPPLEKSGFTTKDIIESEWGMMTATLFFRKESFVIPDWISSIRNGDYALQLLVSLKGKVNYMPEYMALYRRHYGNATTYFNPFFSVNALHTLFKYFNSYTGGKFRDSISNKMEHIYKDKISYAKECNFRRQAIALSLAYASSKIGIDILPVISRIPFFYK